MKKIQLVFVSILTLAFFSGCATGEKNMLASSYASAIENTGGNYGNSYAVAQGTIRGLDLLVDIIQNRNKKLIYE